MNKPTYTVMVGVPGSGKSTTINKLVENNPNTVIVCPDEYRKELGGAYNNFNYDKKIWNTICPEAVAEALESGKDVIFDATNVAVKRRESILKWVEGIDCEKVVIVMDVDKKTALMQNQLRDPEKIVPDIVIHRMSKQFVMPTIEEGFDKVLTHNDV